MVDEGFMARWGGRSVGVWGCRSVGVPVNDMQMKDYACLRSNSWYCPLIEKENIMTTDAIVDTIRRFDFTPATSRPRLLFGSNELPMLRARVTDRPGMLARMRAQAVAVMAVPAATIDVLQPYLSAAEALSVAQAYALTGEREYAGWSSARMAALLTMESWFSPVHVGGCRVCDHVMANVASSVAQVHDLLGDFVNARETAAIVTGLRRLHFAPFLDGTAGALEWWFRPDTVSNWKIMTCGETGLAMCGYVEDFPDAPEVLARAAQGVLEVLDIAPCDGDWPEGVGYWFHTLRYGMQYARALRRLTGGAINLFRHPCFQVTGDFLLMLTTPAGRIYNFNDCDPDFSAGLTEVLTLLAAESGRGDWMAIARAHPAATLPALAYDDSAIVAEPPTRTVAAFPATGVATMRSGWQPEDTFIGLKSGPSTAGHSHLDANSFLLEAGGARLVTDYAYWPQAHFLGYFDPSGPRWQFDGLATIGHSTLQVDGRGQEYGPDCGGRIVTARDEGAYALLAGDAAHAYPGRLTKYLRTILLLKPGSIVVRDVVECTGDRHVEWLLHYLGSIRDDGMLSIIEHEGITLTITPLLPSRAMGWRVNDVARTSSYECSDTRKATQQTIRYRGFAPFRAAPAYEFLFGLCVNQPPDFHWLFTPEESGWTLRASGQTAVIRPDGDTIQCTI